MGIEQQTLPKQIQESDPSSRSIEISPSNTSSKSTSIEISNDDLNHPIALRKGVRSYTSHPIYNFVSYEGLSPSFHVFVTNLDKIQIPNTIQEALMLPK